jgi:hypothetical protein
MDLRLDRVAENSKDFGRCNLAFRIPSRFTLSVMQISPLAHPRLVLSVQVRSQAKAPVQTEQIAGEPLDDDHRQTLREAALFQAALRATGRLADRLDAISLL